MFICALPECLMFLEARSHKFTGTGITDGCEAPSEYWESNLDPLEAQVLLTSKPSLQPVFSIFILSVQNSEHHYDVSIQIMGIDHIPHLPPLLSYPSSHFTQSGTRENDRIFIRNYAKTMLTN